MAHSLKDHVSETATWIRLIYLVIYIIIFSLVSSLVVLVSVAQFLLKLFTGSSNSRLKLLGRDLGIYVSTIVAFVTFHGTIAPYPFSAWPSGPENPVTTPKTASKTAPGKARSAAKKSPTKKSPTKKSPARKPSAKRSPARRRAAPGAPSSPPTGGTSTS